MKKALVFALAAIMIFTAIPAAAAYAVGTPEISYTEHLTNNSDTGYDYDITGASIAWVKQAKGALIWVDANDTRDDDAIIAQGKEADPSLANAVSEFAVLKGLGTAETPNNNGSKAVVTVSVKDGKTILSIDGKYSHFVAGTAANDGAGDVTVPDETVAPEAPAVPEATTAPADPAEEDPAVQGDVGTIRIDAPLKMAVEFADGTVYYGGEMKEVVFGQEYAFRMCSVNWENGLYDAENGIQGTVVYRMVVVHRDEFNALAREAAQNPERYTVKGIDIIDNVEKKIIVNGDAKDTHLETDVNNFFVAYRFHFTGTDYNKKTGIDKVINKPVESLSVNLPVGSTITCKAFNGDEYLGSDNVFITTNNGEGEYENEYLTSVNDYTWNF